MNAKNEIKVGMISLGCAKNKVDAEVMLGLIKKDGYLFTNDPADADVICINTCGFIDSAKQESIDTILEMAEYKKTGKCKGIIVTGCLAERYADEIRKSLPEVNAVVGVGGYDRICECIEAVLSNTKTKKSAKADDHMKYFYTCQNDSLDYLNEDRVLTTPVSYAYLKIAEGCNNRCTYCAIPAIRGNFRSRPLADLEKEAKGLAARGVKEIIVVAQDTPRYGTDLTKDGSSMLPELIRKLDKIDGIIRIRILYLYPDEITDEIIDAIKKSKKVAHYVDIPLQHISDEVLKRMNRRGGTALINDVIAKFREAMPDCIIRTSLITGFPGETTENHHELEEFLKAARLDRVGIFTYSKEEGTPAAKMKPQVPKAVKERRYNQLMKIQQKISLEKNKERVGKVYNVIVDGVSDDGLFYIGRSYGESPDETDGLIYFVAKDELEIGDTADVKILVSEDYDLTGEQI